MSTMRVQTAIDVLSGCDHMLDLGEGIGTAVRMVRNGETMRASQAYGILATLARRVEMLAPDAELGSSAARRDIAEALAADAAIRILYIAVTKAEIEALAEDSAEHIKRNPYGRQ